LSKEAFGQGFAPCPSSGILVHKLSLLLSWVFPAAGNRQALEDWSVALI
jgi:hypothetical protein